MKTNIARVCQIGTTNYVDYQGERLTVEAYEKKYGVKLKIPKDVKVCDPGKFTPEEKRRAKNMRNAFNKRFSRKEEQGKEILAPGLGVAFGEVSNLEVEVGGSGGYGSKGNLFLVKYPPTSRTKKLKAMVCSGSNMGCSAELDGVYCEVHNPNGTKNLKTEVGGDGSKKRRSTSQ